MAAQQEMGLYVPEPQELLVVGPEEVEDYARLLPQLSSTLRTPEEIRVNLQRAVDSPTTRIGVIRDGGNRV